MHDTISNEIIKKNLTHRRKVADKLNNLIHPEVQSNRLALKAYDPLYFFR